MIEAVQAARKHGAIVSYDLNYRPSLWKSIGGQKRAQEVNREIARHVDVMLGNEEDFTACLGFEVEGADEHLRRIDVTAFKQMIGQAVKAYPNFKVVATTLRAVKTATRNDWGAICWAGGKFYEAPNREDLEILDRVGRRRQLRQRADLRLDAVQRPAEGRRVRRRARRAGHDHARRHFDGLAQGSRGAGQGRQRAGAEIDAVSSNAPWRTECPQPGAPACCRLSPFELCKPATCRRSGLVGVNTRTTPYARTSSPARGSSFR